MLRVAIGKNEVGMTVVVDVAYRNVDRGIDLVSECLGILKLGRAIVEVDQVLSAASVG